MSTGYFTAGDTVGPGTPGPVVSHKQYLPESTPSGPAGPPSTEGQAFGAV